MITAQPKEIAKYFRESVDFDFKKNNITSYAQLAANDEAFFTLLDRDAFGALLHDCLDDNQLTDIFMDVFDAEMGITKFADEANRTSPKQYISYFLSTPAYAYHQNDLAKVYICFNTWLSFFGAAVVATEWTKCPYCGGSVMKNGTCTKCKQKTSAALKAVSELTAMLARERNGEQTLNPSYWETITEGGEFYAEFKREILEIRQRRLQAERVGNEKEILAKVAVATKLADECIAEIKLQSHTAGASVVDIVAEFTSKREVVEALAVEPTFSAKIDEVCAVADQEAFAVKFDEACKSIVDIVRKLDDVVFDDSYKASDLQALLDNADEVCAVISSGVAQGKEIGKDAKVAYDRFGMDLRSCVVARLQNLRDKAQLDEKQTRLACVVSELSKELDAQMDDNIEASVVVAKLDATIVNNVEYDELRTARKDQYDKLTAELCQKVQKYADKQTSDVEKSFNREANRLLAQVKASRPSQKKSSALCKAEAAIKNNPTYKNLLNLNSAAKRKMADIRKRIKALSEEEVTYIKDKRANEAARKVAVKKAVKQTIITVVVLAVLFGGFVLAEFVGLLPFNVFMEVTARGFNLQPNNDEGDQWSVFGYDGDQTHVVVPSKMRKQMHVAAYPVTRVEGLLDENSKVTMVQLPETVEYVNGAAFSAATELTTIVLRSATPPQLKDDVFPEGVTIYVPAENYDEYIQADGWISHERNIFPDYYDYNMSGESLSHKEKYGTIVLRSEYAGYGRLLSYLTVLKDVEFGAPTTLPKLVTETSEVYYWYIMDSVGFTSQRFEVEQPIEFTRSLKLDASWNARRFNVSFDLCGGVSDEDTNDITVYYGDFVKGFPQVTRTGYNFVGWFDDDGNEIVSYSTSITKDTVCHARWEGLKFDVTFSNGIGSSKNGVATYGSVLEFPDFVRDGYTLVGWTDMSGNIVDVTAPYSYLNSQFFTAQWRKMTFKVQFTDDNGNAIGTEQTYTYGDTVPWQSFDKTGYSLNGWLDEATGILYEQETGIRIVPTQDGMTITLKADLYLTTYLIVYTVYGGTLPNNPLSYTVEDEIVLLPPQKDGYVFGGWYTDPTFAEESLIADNTVKKGTTGALYLYAKWIAE